MLIIANMNNKPADCTKCPMCDSYDDCILLPYCYKEWDDQYANCPLVEVEGECKKIVQTASDYLNVVSLANVNANAYTSSE